MKLKPLLLIAGIAIAVSTVATIATNTLATPPAVAAAAAAEPDVITAAPAAYDNAVNPKPLIAGSVKDERLLERTGYTVSYNPHLRQPNYVAWTLTAARTYGDNRRDPQFYEDAALPAHERALLSDYYNSGLSRGHLCPAADNKWSATAMRESFLLSNICPQTMALNGGDWEELESWCRKYVRRHRVSLHIISGPVFTTQPPKLRRKRLYEPDLFFKAIVCLDGGAERGIAFVYPNGTERHPMSHYTCTIRYVEQLTGLDLFHSLPRKLQNRLETQSNLNEWLP